MCITIPSSANIDRSRQLPLWQWLIDSPIRLLSAGGGISICLGLLHWRYGMSVTDGWLSFNLLYGVLPFFLFPQLLAYLPSRLKVSPLRYVGYGSLFFLMLAAQLVFYLSIILGDRPGMTYLLLTLMAWLFLLRVITNFLRSSYVAAGCGIGACSYHYFGRCKWLSSRALSYFRLDHDSSTVVARRCLLYSPGVTVLFGPALFQLIVISV